GFMVLNHGLVPKITVGKQTTDVHTTVLFQYICDEYMNKYDYAGHIAKIRKLYQHKADLMVSEMEKEFDKSVKFKAPDGGLFVMAFLPSHIDSYPFVQEGIRRGVATVPAIAFAADPNGIYNGFRMNYSSETDENIIKGVKILGDLIKDTLNNK
ncbi:MAG: PLP-dependent aminotransferase family protein, partial [Oscillospiraceae bacterium]